MVAVNQCSTWLDQAVITTLSQRDTHTLHPQLPNVFFMQTEIFSSFIHILYPTLTRRDHSSQIFFHMRSAASGPIWFKDTWTRTDQSLEMGGLGQVQKSFFVLWWEAYQERHHPPHNSWNENKPWMKEKDHRLKASYSQSPAWPGWVWAPQAVSGCCPPSSFCSITPQRPGGGDRQLQKVLE